MYDRSTSIFRAGVMGPRFPLVAVLLVLCSSRSVVAQNRPVDWVRWQTPPLAPAHAWGGAASTDSGSTVNTAFMVVSGVVGGAAGLFGGAIIGGTLGGGNSICYDDPCGLEEALLGAVLGESVLLPLGVHLANHSHGNYGYSLLGSLAVGAVGIGLAGAIDSTELLLAVPIGQIISSVLIERATSRPKASAR